MLGHVGQLAEVISAAFRWSCGRLVSTDQRALDLETRIYPWGGDKLLEQR